MSNSFRVLAEMQEAKRIQRFPELDTIIDMVNWWIMCIIKEMLIGRLNVG